MTQPKKSLAERVRELAGIILGSHPDSKVIGRPIINAELESIAADLERLAGMLREDGDPTCVNYVADQLAEKK